MPEKTKAKKEIEENCETDEKSVWSNDQQEKSYYYDDSHGYKIYNPDEDEEEDDAER